jgi:HTH-type transcriptional regulator/antitoxin HipB
MNRPIRIRTSAELGAALRQHRRDSSHTQQQLADVANLSLKFVSQLERGKETAELGKALKALERAGLQVWIADRTWHPDVP